MATGESKRSWKKEITDKSKDNQLGYSISYDGKKNEKEVLTDTVRAKLHEVWRGSQIETAEQLGHLYFGDNLGVLANLYDNKNIKGRVKLIYIDPPFATNQVFLSRTRNGGYKDLLIGRHYIEFLRERLIFLKELLASDGSIYVHIDENMAFELKLILDEIFGRKNFHNFIVRKKSNPKNYTRKQFGDISDYILFYTKSSSYTWNRPYTNWLPEDSAREYSYVEEGTGRRYKRVPIHAPGIRNGDTGKPWKGMNPPPGKHWQYKRATLDELDAKGAIYWSSNGNPRRKIYFDENLGIPVQDIWLDVKDPHNQNIKITGYPTEKNPALLERIISASSNPGDLVLDCFAGSGTTMGVAASMGRRWIGIDNSLEAIHATLTRFIHGLQPMGDYVSKKSQQGVLFDDLEAQKYLATMGLYVEEKYIENKDFVKELKRLDKYGKTT